MALTGKVIKDAINNIDNAEDFAEKLAKAITDNLEVSIPTEKVITLVSGGSGTPAVGFKNKKPIKLNVR